jgi:hypothetical protein
VSLLRRLFHRLLPSRLGTGVRPLGQEAFVIAIGPRSYWVHARRQATRPAEYLVWTSDIRDITRAPTIVAAPPASEEIVPEVKRRLRSYFEGSRLRVRYR